jgi:beta-mannanase
MPAYNLKRLKLWLVVLVIPFLAIAVAYRPIKKLIKSYSVDEYYLRSQEPGLGILSRTGDTTTLKDVTITHGSLIWKSTGIWFNNEPLQKQLARGPALITIETWLKGSRYGENVLNAICHGKFDKNIQELAALIAQSKYDVYIRFDPDMEVPATVFPWQYQSPENYNHAFNYVAKKLKLLAPKVKMVWGPSGYPGDTEYWPGSQLVDAVSITLGSLSEDNAHAYPTTTSVLEMLKQKLHRMRFINKPVIILGSNHVQQKNFNAEWLKAEAAYLTQLSKTAIYSKNNFVNGGPAKPVRKKLAIGVYDPQEKLIKQGQITAEHIFTDLGEVQRNEFEKKFTAIVNRHHDAIITMEPWRDTSGTTDTQVVKHILQGRYNNVFSKLFKILGQTRQTVYLRFMHEMEIPIHRYAWQSQDPVQYIQAYRYFMQLNGGPPPNVKKVWAPAGDRGSVDYWPGDDVVDYISIAIYGLPDKNITDPNKQELFSDIFKRKYYRMRFLSKPLFIAEFGVKGPEAFQNQWLQNAAVTVKANPHVFGVSYFNLYDNPKVWGHMPAPDWSISPRSMQKFINGIIH